MNKLLAPDNKLEGQGSGLGMAFGGQPVAAIGA
jgi:hypothetical protein